METLSALIILYTIIYAIYKNSSNITHENKDKDKSIFWGIKTEISGKLLLIIKEKGSTSNHTNLISEIKKKARKEKNTFQWQESLIKEYL